MSSDMNDGKKYPFPTNTGLRFLTREAHFRAHGIPDPEDLGKVVKLLSAPGSKARVKWAGDKEWTDYSNPG